MPFLHRARLGSADLDKVTLATASNVFLESGETAANPTSATFVTFAGTGFEALRLPC